MKGLEKLTTIRLAEVLTQRGSIPSEAITDALYAQDRQGESFVDGLVAHGHISEWDLAKLVAENFQLPFVTASSHEVDNETLARFPKEFLFQHRIVPLTVFEDVATIVLPILVPYEALVKLQDQTKLELFPYVGLLSENTRVLGELFPDYADWVKSEAIRREAKSRMTKKGGGGGGGGGGAWAAIFDSADASVRDSLKKGG